MNGTALRLYVLLLGVILLGGCGTAPPDEAPAATPEASRGPEAPAASDPRAVEIARSVVDRMGGWDNWNATRYVSWRFFGRRMHHWDRYTGDVRIEAPTEEGTLLVLMNIDTLGGEAWLDGEPVTDPDRLAAALQGGHEAWVNDSYWMFMPYKLLDPGTRLTYLGEGSLPDGRPTDLLELTFDTGVGYTPSNRYVLGVAKDSGLVEQWAFYADANDEEPRFVMPWSDWRPFGGILLATNHGRDMDWEIAVHEDLPESVFRLPDPVTP